MPGSPQHAIKVKDKNKADSKKGIKVHSVSVLYRAEAIRTTVVPISILIHTTVMPIRILIRTTGT